MFRYSACKLKAWGMILSIILFGSTVYAQQTGNSQQPQTFTDKGLPSSDDQQTQQSEIEKQRKWAEEQVRKSIVPEAVTVIKEINQAINLIKNGKSTEALSAIERATGKIDLLLARHPESALLPLDFNINVINSAPVDLDIIKEVGQSVVSAVKDKNFPEARFLLDSLRSEISITTYSLPLGIYPAALKTAANLLDRKRSNEASELLTAALHSLIWINQVIPIPLINAEAWVAAAEQKYKQDKDGALVLIDDARYELERARDLGYVEKNDEEYTALNDAIKDLENQVKGNQGNDSAFHNLKNKLGAFWKRHFEKKKQTNELKAPEANKS